MSGSSASGAKNGGMARTSNQGRRLNPASCCICVILEIKDLERPLTPAGSIRRRASTFQLKGEIDELCKGTDRRGATQKRTRAVLWLEADT